MAEASTSSNGARQAASTAGALSDSTSTDELLALADELARLTPDQAIGPSVQRQIQQDIRQRRALEAKLLEQAPSFVQLHNDLQSSRTLLTQLESFLTVFHTDLNVLSSQMSELQGKSLRLSQRLRNRRQLEGKIRNIVGDIVLEPSYIELIFADEVTASRAGLEAWKGCAERLSACLLACAEMEGILRDQLHLSSDTGTRPTAPMDIQALKEAQELAEACRIMAASKIRPLLISTFAPLRSSLSTNMPILQAVLLKSYRPLFMFLSQHAPRIAIDVQRAYLAAARLYFETGFRRYERNLARLRDREKARRADATSAAVGFAEVAGRASTSVTSMAAPLFSAATGAKAPPATSTDPWDPTPSSHLDNAKVVDGPAVTLAYLADDSSYSAPIEALFRSLSLTFLDNASSEYCFLARFFEGIDLDSTREPGSSSAGGSQITGSSGVKVRHADAQPSTAEEGDETFTPNDSASQHGEQIGDMTASTMADEAAAQAHGTVTSLSAVERRRIRARGAIDGLWKQAMEPVVGTYNTFVTSLVALQPPLIPLYTMVKLNDRLLAEAETRGVMSVLQSTLMGFKLKAWPMVQKQFDEAIESVRKVRTSNGGMATVGGSGGMAAAASSLLGGFFGGSASSSSTANPGTASDPNQGGNTVAHLICTRYARLYAIMVHLNAPQPGTSDADEDPMIFQSLGRLRGEVEAMLDAMLKADRSASARTAVSACHRTIRSTLEQGPAALTLARMQGEMSHWSEADRTRLQLNR